MGEQNVGSPCMAVTGKFPVKANINFTDEDVAALNKAYFEGARISRMSDVPGVICWRDMGPSANRRYADLISGRCGDVLKGEGAKEKCDALYEVVDYRAQEKKGVGYWILEVGQYIVGLIGVWLIFAPGLRSYNKWADKRDAKKAEKNNKKGPPDDAPPTGTGGGGTEEVSIAQARAVFGEFPPAAVVDQPQVAPAPAQMAPGMPTVDPVEILQQSFLGRHINFAEMAQNHSLTHVATLDKLRGELPSPSEMDYTNMPDSIIEYDYVWPSSTSGHVITIPGMCSSTSIPFGMSARMAEVIPFPTRMPEVMPGRAAFGIRFLAGVRFLFAL